MGTRAVCSGRVRSDKMMRKPWGWDSTQLHEMRVPFELSRILLAYLVKHVAELRNSSLDALIVCKPLVLARTSVPGVRFGPRIRIGKPHKHLRDGHTCQVSLLAVSSTGKKIPPVQDHASCAAVRDEETLHRELFNHVFWCPGERRSVLSRTSCFQTSDLARENSEE